MREKPVVLSIPEKLLEQYRDFAEYEGGDASFKEVMVGVLQDNAPKINHFHKDTSHRSSKPKNGSEKKPTEDEVDKLIRLSEQQGIRIVSASRKLEVLEKDWHCFVRETFLKDDAEELLPEGHFFSVITDNKKRGVRVVSPENAWMIREAYKRIEGLG